MQLAAGHASEAAAVRCWQPAPGGAVGPSVGSALPRAQKTELLSGAGRAAGKPVPARSVILGC